MYWDRVTPAGWDAHVNDVKKLRAQAQQIEARTVDKVTVGDLTSETAHQFEVEGNSITGRGNYGWAMHVPWREMRTGQSVAYRMKVPRDEPVTIRCYYFVKPYQQDTDVDIQVDGASIAHEKGPVSFDSMAVDYPVPPEITKGKDEIVVGIRVANPREVAEMRIAELRILNLEHYAERLIL